MVTINQSATGFVFSRMRRAMSATVQANRYKIKNGYASKIAMGDPVQTGTSTNQGYVIIAPNTPTAILGIFAGVLPYYDTNLAGVSFGLNGAYNGSAVSPQGDVDCLVIDDPDAVFRVQVYNAAWAQSWRGLNCQLLAGSQGVPSAAGISTAAIDGGTAPATTSTFPFRIQELVAVQPGGLGLSSGIAFEEGGGTGDTALTNPWIEVCINYNVSELTNPTGV